MVGVGGAFFFTISRYEGDVGKMYFVGKGWFGKRG